MTSPISTTRHHDILIVTSNNPPVNALGAAVYLASPASTFMTGQVMVVDGGSTIGIGL